MKTFPTDMTDNQVTLSIIFTETRAVARDLDRAWEDTKYITDDYARDIVGAGLAATKKMLDATREWIDEYLDTETGNEHADIERDSVEG